MPKKFIQNIQKLIDNTDQKRDLGSVAETNISNFKFTPKNLTGTVPVEEQEKPPKQQNNITWLKTKFFHNRGRSIDLFLTDFLTNIKKINTTKTSVNGNIEDYFKNNNTNVFYRAGVSINDTANVALEIRSSAENSLAIYLRHENDLTATKVYTSGNEPFLNGTVFLPFDKTGGWEITILYYHETGPSIFNISGDLGSYVADYDVPSSISTTETKQITFATSKGTNGIESIFIDGKQGPALSNIIYWDKLNSFTDQIGGESIVGYNVNFISTENTELTVTSGWGTDAFVVVGDKRSDFPIAGIATIPVTSYQISGTQLETNINQTIVTVSGTSFGGSASDIINLERSIHLFSVNQSSTLGQIISGAHNNVKAGETYTYEIEAFNEFGNKGFTSDRVSVKAGDIIPPGPVTSLAGTGSLKAIRLTWTNPDNIDLKGIHVFDTATVISGTTKPIATLIKGSNTTIPEEVVINEVSSGTLIDAWPYDLYAATFDHAGNSSTESMPTVNVTTDVALKTSQDGQRIETDTSTNQLRFFDSNDNLVLKMGENIISTFDGLLLDNNAVFLHNAGQYNISDEDVGSFNNETGLIKAIRNITDGITVASPTLVNMSNIAASSTITDNIPSASFHSSGRLSMIHGILQNVGSTTFDGTFIAIYGEVLDIGSEIPNVYSGYFTGAKVFVENDLIISGSGGIKASSGFQDLDGDTRIQVEESTDEDIIRFDIAGSERMTVSGTSVGIGKTAPSAKLHIDQASVAAAEPVLLLDQASLSEELIEFNTTVGIGNPIESIGVKTLTTTHFLKITIPGGLTRYIPCGTIA